MSEEHEIRMTKYTKACLEKAAAVGRLLKDSNFLKACEKAGLKPTRRQARKWLQRRGRARTAAHGDSKGGIGDGR